MDEWNKANEKGTINVPDELVPLFNSVAMQLNFHIISGKNFNQTVADIVWRAEQFFKDQKPLINDLR